MIDRDRTYSQLARLAGSDFADIVDGTSIIEGKLRLFLKDRSFIDIWLSVKKKGVYAYHWERRDVDRTIYRHNNLPDREARKLKTYPRHFHNRTEKNIVESNLSDKPEEALRTILEFARKVINRK